jgi:hypothetical protein
VAAATSPISASERERERGRKEEEENGGGGGRKVWFICEQHPLPVLRGNP